MFIWGLSREIQIIVSWVCHIYQIHWYIVADPISISFFHFISSFRFLPLISFISVQSSLVSFRFIILIPLPLTLSFPLPSLPSYHLVSHLPSLFLLTLSHFPLLPSPSSESLLSSLLSVRIDWPLSLLSFLSSLFPTLFVLLSFLSHLSIDPSTFSSFLLSPSHSVSSFNMGNESSLPMEMCSNCQFIPISSLFRGSLLSLEFIAFSWNWIETE